MKKSNNSFYTNDELIDIGFKYIGRNVLISRKASIYSPGNISIGDNVRIDDFSILSATGGSITINNHIHIAAFCNIIGKGCVVMKDFSALSSRVSLYSATDDFGGDYLVGPVMDGICINVRTGKIIIDKYVAVGSNSTIFPNVYLKEGSILGTHSYTFRNLGAWKIYLGNPAKFIMLRKKGLLKLLPIMEKKWTEKPTKN